MDTVLTISAFAIWSCIVAWVNYRIGYQSAKYDMAVRAFEQIEKEFENLISEREQ